MIVQNTGFSGVVSDCLRKVIQLIVHGKLMPSQERALDWLVVVAFRRCLPERTWAVSRKRRNKLVHSLLGNRRFVNVNICGKGRNTIKKILSQLDPDVLVVTEPGSLGARPSFRGFHTVRHKNIAVLLREKSTTLISNESVWVKERLLDESFMQRTPEEETEKDLKGKKKVRFDDVIATKTEQGVELTKLVERDKDKMPDVRILKTVFRMGGVQWTLLSVYGPQKDDAARKTFWQKLDDNFHREGGSLKDVTCWPEISTPLRMLERRLDYRRRRHWWSLS